MDGAGWSGMEKVSSEALEEGCRLLLRYFAGFSVLRFPDFLWVATILWAFLPAIVALDTYFRGRSFTPSHS